MTTDQLSSNAKISWQPVSKPTEIAEMRLIDAIINGTFPINATLPGERELSELLGVTRPTLRETLQRMQRDGWIEIHQGKPTRVKDYWKEGKLGVLNALSEHINGLPEDFVPNLLKVRLALAPAYTGQAVSNAGAEVFQLLEGRYQLADSPEKFSQFDWDLQHGLTLLSENPIFVMILNGFETLFMNLAPIYFDLPQARKSSLIYYESLSKSAAEGDDRLARSLTEKIMHESLKFWSQIYPQ